MGNSKLITELYLTKNQVNGLLYVIDCYLQSNADHKYVEFAEKMKQKIIKHGRLFKSRDGETLALHMYDTDFTVMIKLLSTYISAVQEMPKDYFSDIVDAKNQRTISA